MGRLDAALYRGVAALAARALGGAGDVRGVYTRRSLACGEVTLGRSDIDLTLMVGPAPGPAAEGAALARLAARFAALRRVVPIVGTCEIGTRAELEDWYRAPWSPASLCRDRGWLRLAGERFVPPAPASGEVGRTSHLRWLLWAWESLPRFLRAGDARTSANLLLDMVNAAYLYTGRLDAPTTRAALVARWEADGGAHARLRGRLAPILRGRRGTPEPALCRTIYAAALRLSDELAAAVTPLIGGRVGAAELVTAVPFSFASRRYLLVDPADEAAVARALDVMANDPRALATSERALRLYWHHRNPWEYFARGAAAARASVARPPDAAMRAAVRYHLHRLVPRRLGLSIGRRNDRGATIGPRYAQVRLWAEHGVVAEDAADLTARYRTAYGVAPHATPRRRDAYFTALYPRLCAESDAIGARLPAD